MFFFYFCSSRHAEDDERPTFGLKNVLLYRRHRQLSATLQAASCLSTPNALLNMQSTTMELTEIEICTEIYFLISNILFSNYKHIQKINIYVSYHAEIYTKYIYFLIKMYYFIFFMDAIIAFVLATQSLSSLHKLRL